MILKDTYKNNDELYEHLGSLGFDGSIDDRIFKYLRSEGYTGAISDMTKAWQLSSIEITNLLQNGNFATDTIWTKINGATIASPTGAALPATGEVRQSFPTEVGVLYQAEVTIFQSASRGILRVGTTSGGLDLYNSASYVSTGGLQTFTFTATTTTSHFTIINDIGSSRTLGISSAVVLPD